MSLLAAFYFTLPATCASLADTVKTGTAPDKHHAPPPKFTSQVHGIWDEDEESSGDYDEILQMEDIELLQEKVNVNTSEEIEPQPSANASDADASNVTAEKDEAIPEPEPLFSDGQSKGSDVEGETLDGDADRSPTSVVESEGLFPVTKTYAAPASEGDSESPYYSGDGDSDVNATDDPETSAYLSVLHALPVDFASGDGHLPAEVELATSPPPMEPSEPAAVKPPGLASTERPPILIELKPKWWGGPAASRCEATSCEKRHHLRVASSSMGGTVVPSATVLTIRCTAHHPINDTAAITWHVPARAAFATNDTLYDGGDEFGAMRRVNVTEDVTELRAKGERVTVSTLRVLHLSEDDAGPYTCTTVLPLACCHSNVTVDIKVYTPPSYALDFAIVGAVCFVEFLIILYFKTRAGRKKASTTPRTNGYSGDYKPVPTDPSKDHPIEEEVQQQLLT